MEEQRKYAILFAATILAARKLNDPNLKPWPRTAIIRDAISSANQILEEIDAKWPSRKAKWHSASFVIPTQGRHLVSMRTLSRIHTGKP